MVHLKNGFIFLLIALNSLDLFSQDNKGFAIVELFTSEGNAQSPDADKLLSEIAKEARLAGKNVYCLKYHVDYWNKLGWKDPYSKIQFTRRQENYSRVLPSKEMYTPQVIVNGVNEFTGADATKIRASINSALNSPSSVQLSLHFDSLRSDTVFISWSLSKEDKNNVLQLALTENGLISKVEKGENAGKTLNHDNVIRVFTAVNNPGLKGQAKMILKNGNLTEAHRIIGFIQQKQSYKITAAIAIDVLR